MPLPGDDYVLCKKFNWLNERQQTITKKWIHFQINENDSKKDKMLELRNLAIIRSTYKEQKITI